MTVAHRVLDPSLSGPVGAGLCALAVMTKAPRAGQVKTRLIPPLTAREAATLNTCFLRDTTAAIFQTTKGGLAAGVAVYTPVGAESAYGGILPEDFMLLPQRGQIFGERLTRAAEDLFALGFESVCLINSDSPTVPPSAFAEARQVLSHSSDRLVLGPSEDGGYYLIGLKKLHQRVFDDIEWSTEKVLKQTMERAAEVRLEVHLLPTGFDVDDRRMLRRLCDEIFTPGAQKGFVAPATQAYLAEIIQGEGRNRIWPNESSAISAVNDA